MALSEGDRLTDNQDLLAFLQAEEARSYDGALLEEVETALNSYNGQPYGDEEDGRSQVVARDVSETVDYMLTSIMDVFAGSGRVVEFEPTDESEEDACDDATEAMHYIYRRKAGYRFIHDWAKAGLLEKIAISKSCVERKRKRVENLYHPAMMPDDAIEAEETEELHPVDGSPMIKAVTIEEGPVGFPDYFVPLEEFRRSPDARDLDSAVYLAHVSEKSLSELTEMGFDPEQLEGVQGDNPNMSSILTARDDGRSTMGTDRQGALRKVWLCEEYVLYDLNGDGLAERLCIHRVGNTILNVEEVDYQPFEFWCPYPMQGRLVGQSLADKTVDIQRVNSVLERNALDSLYSQVAQGHYVHEDSIGDHTLDDLLTVHPRRVVRYRGAVPPIPEVKNDVSQVAFNAIEFKIRQRESRTGITRLNKGVDEDVLNDTASGQMALMSRGQQMERYVIRNFGEGVARLFMKKVGLMRRYGQPFQIRVDGQFREVDPSQWPESMEIDVKVGLGSGQKDERIGYRNLIAQAHMALVGSGSPLVTPENVYNNMAGFCKDAGLPPNDLFTHPEDAPPQQPQPDPEMMKAQAELQIKQQAHEGDMQIKSADLQGKQQEMALKLELERAKAEEAAQLARDKAEFEREQAIAQMMFERQLAREQFEHDKQMAEQKAKADAEAKKYRDGGSLAA